MNAAVFGAKGRMGSKVTEIAVKRGHSVWKLDKNYSENRLNTVDVVINFASAEGIYDVCAFCKERLCPLVTGTTGLDAEQRAALDDLSKYVAVIEKANFSAGMDMLYKVCETLSRELSDWDCAIVEIHRKGKKDAPSGTAKEIAGKIVNNLGSFRSVETHSLRIGSNFGRHEVTFAADGESLTITHQAENSDVFALGAVKTAEQIVRALPFGNGFTAHNSAVR